MRLVIVNVGGKRPPAICETHEIRAVIARSVENAMSEVATAVKDTLLSPHIDGYLAVNLRPAEGTSEKDLFFVETGLNGPGFSESHLYHLIWAKSTLEARNVAKNHDRKWHVDTVFNLSRMARQSGYDIEGDAQQDPKDFSTEMSLYAPIN